MPGAPRVLVVEDDARLAATLQRVLAAEGHEVEVAGDGLDALRKAKVRPPDLAVLDVMLPGADGITVCRRMRETAQFPILMLTALSGTEQRVRGLDSGADDYLVKPFAYQELLTREQLLAAVWADEPDGDNVVAVYVGYLRQKLEEGGEPRLLHTVRGSGYALREA
jgi:DNA-binding response OmpR family regulator